MNQSKARKKKGAFVLEGIRLLEEAVNTQFAPQMLLYTSDLDQRGRQLVQDFETRGVVSEETLPDVLGSVSDTETPQGILAVYPLFSLPFPDPADFLLIADQIRDPGNLGTLLRSALAAGAQGVVLSPGTVDPFSPKVVRAAMGSHFHLPILTTSWTGIKTMTRGLTIFLADTNEGVNLWQSNLRDPLAIIIGSEAHGPGKSARELANHNIHIPINEKSESINAAAAGAVLLFEIRRQRSIAGI